MSDAEFTVAKRKSGDTHMAQRMAQVKGGDGVFFEKSVVINRGPRLRDIGMGVTFSTPAEGGTHARIRDITPGGLADTAGDDTSRLEVDDEIIAVAGFKLCDLTLPEVLHLFKQSSVSLSVRAMLPGAEGVDLLVNREDETKYYETSSSMLHRLAPSDLVLLDQH